HSRDRACTRLGSPARPGITRNAHGRLPASSRISPFGRPSRDYRNEQDYYFYEDAPSIEMRFHTREELQKGLRSSPETILAVDPIVQRLPEAQAWFDAARAGHGPSRILPIQMYEPVYYQGFDPTTPLEAVPRLIAPFRPGEAVIAVYRVSSVPSGSEQG